MKIDPIEAARASTNRGKIHQEAKRVYRLGWNRLTAEHNHNNALKKHWQPAVRAMRKALTGEFRHEKWKGISFEWLGQGYHQSGIDLRTTAWMHYAVFWKGLRIERQFTPIMMEDILCEAWRLGGALVGWQAGRGEGER